MAVRKGRASDRGASRPCVVCGGPVRDVSPKAAESHRQSKKHRDAVAKFLKEN